jgi:hypothetical protein
LHNALLELELREQDVARLEQRNAYLERELKIQGQYHTNALKDVVMLKQRTERRMLAEQRQGRIFANPVDIYRVGALQKTSTYDADPAKRSLSGSPPKCPETPPHNE